MLKLILGWEIYGDRGKPIQRFIHGLRSTIYLWYDIYNTCTNNFVNFVENDYD